MFGFIKKVFIATMTFFSFSVLNVDSSKCVTMSNQICRVGQKIIDTNNSEPVFCPYSIKINRCSGSCSIINDPYGKICIPDAVKNKC